jgi:hypothetical protein
MRGFVDVNHKSAHSENLRFLRVPSPIVMYNQPDHIKMRLRIEYYQYRPGSDAL